MAAIRLKAISLRQPWTEKIMRGRKRVEYRGSPTKVRGPIYIFAALGRRPAEEEAEFAEEVGYPIDDLPRGVIVGTVEIVDCQFDKAAGCYGWRLKNPKRLKRPIEPVEHPQLVWFHPFAKVLTPKPAV